MTFAAFCAVVFVVVVVIAAAAEAKKSGVKTVQKHTQENNVEMFSDGDSDTVTIIITKDNVTKKITRKKGASITVRNGELVEGEADVKVVESDEADVKVEQHSVKLKEPGLDAKKEIAKFNVFMDEIFFKMNGAIKAKKLDPMDLRLMHASKMDPSRPRVDVRDRNDEDDGTTTTTTTTTSSTTTTPKSLLIFTKKPTKKPKPPPIAPLEAEDDDEYEDDEFEDDILQPADVAKVRGWLHGMSTLKRSDDVSIKIHEDSCTIQCPFALGPLELTVTKTFGTGKDRKTKTAKATTELMLGYMDLLIRDDGKAEITDVVFDEPGGVDVHDGLGDLTKRRSGVKKVPYR